MRTLVHGLIAILVLAVTGLTWADPPATQQPNYTRYYIHSIGNGTLVVHSCLTPTQFTVNTDEQTVVIRLDGTTGKLSDLRVGQWVKLCRKGDRNDPEHQRIAKIELSMFGQVAAAKLSFDTYSGYFVSNKFEPDAAESFLVITDQEGFDKVFGVAFVMGDKSHRLAKDAFKTLVVVAAIKRGNAVVEFKVEGVTLIEGVAELCYTTTEKKSDTATFACPLIVSIPTGEYKAVQFVENGKAVKKLEVGKKPEAKAEKAEAQRREVFFSGHVQGVGFRQSTATLAEKFAVTGFVKNLPDGRVQLVVEGQPKEIEAFLAAIRKQRAENIKKTEEKTSPATGEFQGFRIRL
jgi:acylphosphatase